MKSNVVLAFLLLSASLVSATGDKETDVGQLRELTEQEGFIPTSMTQYSAVPDDPTKIDEVVSLIGEVLAGAHRIILEPHDDGCFAHPRVESIARHTDLHIKPYDIAYEKETTVHIPLQLTLKGATVEFDAGSRFYVRNPRVLDFEFHRNPRYLVSIIQYYQDHREEVDIVAKAEDLLLIHELAVSDIIKKEDLDFDIRMHSQGSGGLTYSDFLRLGLILGFKVVSVKEIPASVNDVEYTKIEEGTYGATLRFESLLNDPSVILVDRTDGADIVSEKSTIRVRHNTKPLIDVYFVTANLVYFGSFELTVGADLSVSNADTPSIVALRWVDEMPREILRKCQTAE